MRVIASQNRSFIDTQIKGVNTLITLFESALQSGVSITDIPTPGTKVFLVDIPTKEKYNLPLPMLVLPKQKKVRALHQQNYQDLSLQTLGGMEHLFELAILNGVSITGTPVIGNDYKIPESDTSELVEYFDAKGIKIATGNAVHLFENGLFENGLFA